MKCTVFYSWQSDLPNALNRGFIEKALENAARAIHADDSVQVEPVVDRDTGGVPGAPDIARAILAKIDQAHVVVCDVSIIDRKASRPAPNPNVLIELGYALRALGPERVLLVMNKAFGSPEALPFDLRTRRVITYSLDEKSSDRSSARKQLETQLEVGLRTILEKFDRELPGQTVEPEPLIVQATQAVRESRANQGPLVRRYMEGLADEFDALAVAAVSKESPRESYEALCASLGRSEALVAEFAELADAIATTSAPEAAMAMYKGFDRIIRGYWQRRNQGGSFRTTDFDFHKFIGHELLVSFFALLIRDERWELVADLLEEDLFWEQAQSGQGGMVPYTYVASKTELLAWASSITGRESVHADILARRHKEGDLGRLVPLDQFLVADYFLWLRSEVCEPPDALGPWQAWSRPYLRDVPRYLVEASHRKAAARLLRPLGVQSIEMLRERLIKLRATRPGYLDDPLRDFDSQQIGSR